MRKIIATALLVALAGCGTNKKELALTEHADAETEYKIDDVELTLNQDCPGKGYMSEAEIKKTVSDIVRKNVCAVKKCAEKEEGNVVKVSVRTKYRRHFMGEPLHCTNAYDGSIMTIGYEMSKGGNVIYASKSKNMVPRFGALSAGKRILTKLSFQADAEEDKTDVETFASGIADIILEKKDF